MKTALVTGVLGQDGAYLSKLLLDKGYKVFGLIRRYSRPTFDNTDYLGITNDIEYLTGELTDECSLMNIVNLVRPDELYNLAAQSFVGISWEQPKFTTEVNAMGVLYLLNAVKMHSPATKFYQASTSEMFGNSHTNHQQNENTPFHPVSPYAIAKLYAYWIVNNYKQSYGIYCVNGILFNHESPLRGIEFVTRKISDGVARIKLGLASEIRLGNVDSRRDWGYAGDFVEAMYLMLQQEKPDNYVVATGETHSIRDYLTIAFNHAGIADWERFITIDPRFKRPAELHALQGDAQKAHTTLNWKPKVKFEDLVKMMVDADINRLSTKRKDQ